VILAVDTSRLTAVAVVDEDGSAVVELANDDPRAHAEAIGPLLQAALSRVDRGALTAVAYGVGPGPFTGLRVGIVTAATIADARGLPVVGVCSLDAVGSGARTVVTDARRKEVYWAAYDAAGSRVEGPGVERPEELVAEGPFVGDERFAERLGAAVTPAQVTTAGLLRAAASSLADPSSAGPLVPLYLRRPDATPPSSIKTVSQQ
jgi:tRNA threonylcarbamoyl adenosine modification protein YeaZ